MTVTPEDLVECWHLVRANGDEPVEWQLDDNLWQAVRRHADANGVIDDDPVGSTDTLLGTPVTISAGSAPVLRYRSNGKLLSAPIFSPAERS